MAGEHRVLSPLRNRIGLTDFTCPPFSRQHPTQLHTVAAYYPDHPTAEEKDAARGLVAAIARLYPCRHCRAAFQADIADLPPKLDSRAEFSLWMCKQHNRVNAALGKPSFPCDLSRLDERWRTGKPECWGGVGVTGSGAGSGSAVQQTAAESLGQAADDDE
jgi:hypothetical protein